MTRSQEELKVGGSASRSPEPRELVRQSASVCGHPEAQAPRQDCVGEVASRDGWARGYSAFGSILSRWEPLKVQSGGQQDQIPIF